MSLFFEETSFFCCYLIFISVWMYFVYTLGFTLNYLSSYFLKIYWCFCSYFCILFSNSSSVLFNIYKTMLVFVSKYSRIYEYIYIYIYLSIYIYFYIHLRTYMLFYYTNPLIRLLLQAYMCIFISTCIKIYDVLLSSRNIPHNCYST